MNRESPGFRIIPDLEAHSERRVALRALLRCPLLPASGDTAETYLLVRRHVEWLKHWLARFPAWSLHVEPGLARLRKIPSEFFDDTRPAIDRSSGSAFTKHRYALLCLALAALEQLDRQTTLGQLAQTIMELIAVDRDLQASGIFFDSGNYDQRRDLVHAIRFLVESRVLRKVDGDERQFRDRDSEDALYDIDRHFLSQMLQSSHSPSAIEMISREKASQQRTGDLLAERAAGLSHDSIPPTEESRHQWLRSRLVRTLLDDPVLYFEDLNDEERSYLEKHRGPLLRELCEATGLIAEVRREGIALVDNAGDVTDLKLPDQGTEHHLTFLLVQWFAECLKVRRGSPISNSEVEERVRDLIRAHGSEWRHDMREAGVEARISADALLRIRALRLIRVSDEGITPLPASCRYAASGQN
jgi:uncharacterized protein (TIGR02678 family)